MNAHLPNNKKGVTLVESVLALAILALVAVALLSLFTTGSTAVSAESNRAAAYATAVQKMDFLMAAVSDCGASCADPISGELSVAQLKAALPQGSLHNTEITAKVSLYDTSLPSRLENVRGWYLTLTYQGVMLDGFTSYTREVFE